MSHAGVFDGQFFFLLLGEHKITFGFFSNVVLLIKLVLLGNVF